MFRGVYQRYIEQDKVQSDVLHPFPASYRHSLPAFNIDDFVFQVGVENQPARSLSWQQIKALPAFNELRLVASRTGWAYRGNWKGLTFQTVFSLFATPHLYNWVRLESLSGQHMVIERSQLLNWRVLYECDGRPFSSLYGGPLWVHCFDHYLEYSFPHLKSMTLLQPSSGHREEHPNTCLGYEMAQARIDAGDYYLIHEDRIVPLGHLGRK